jgi:hypothetical protein
MKQKFSVAERNKKILNNPNTRPALELEDGSSVGNDNFGKANRYDTDESLYLLIKSTFAQPRL